MQNKMIHVVIDRPIGYVHHGTTYLVNYGYVPGIMGGDGEAQDAYVLGENTPLAVFIGIHIATIHRRDDVECKWIIVPPDTIYTENEIIEQVAFIEQYFDVFVEML